MMPESQKMPQQHHMLYHH